MQMGKAQALIKTERANTVSALFLLALVYNYKARFGFLLWIMQF
jgi:hypothetical protein